VIGCFILGGWNVAEGTEQAVVVEPPDPLEGGELDILDPGPGAARIDELGLVEADDGLGQGVVVAVTSAADRRLDPGQSQTLRVTNRQVLG
jgi:hypothetical protein